MDLNDLRLPQVRLPRYKDTAVRFKAAKIPNTLLAVKTDKYSFVDKKSAASFLSLNISM